VARGGPGIQFRSRLISVKTLSKEFLAHDPNRRYLLIQNNHATGKIWINFDNDANSLSGVPIIAGGYYEPLRVPINSVHIAAEVDSTLVVLLVG